MATSSNEIDTAILLKYFPLNILNKTELEILVGKISVVHAKSGKVLVEYGQVDNKALLLLKGKVKLIDQDEESYIIEAGSEESLRPISNTSPHAYTVKAASTIDFIRIENKIIDNLLDKRAASGGVAQDLTIKRELMDNPVFMDIYRDLLDDKLVIPAFPDMAVKIQQVVNDDYDLREVEKLIQFDPATAAMIVKAANCALFDIGRPVTSIEKAILRMGIKLVKQLVTTYSMRELFNSKYELINRRMKRMWKSSAEVAASSFVLAKKLGKWDAEHALLLGLLHDIGKLPILRYTEKYPDIINTEGKVDNMLQTLHGEIGAVILKAWNFSDDFVITSLESDDWYRDTHPEPDYCDIVLLAQLHSLIGKPKNKLNVLIGDKALPSITELPAFKKLCPGDYGPEEGMVLLNEARQQIKETAGLLALG